MFFLFLFLVASTSRHHSRPDPRWGQLDREANLMWTQNGNVDLGGRNDEWGIMSGNEVICAGRGVGPRTESRGFPSSITLEPNGQ